MAAPVFTDSEICDWLKAIFAPQSLEHSMVRILGTSEKGDGQCGEVIFVETTKETEDLSLALKCSKSNSAIMAQSPVIRDAFRNETYVYEQILPAFKKFQTERGIVNPFDSVPKYYGKYSDESKDVIALENMKQKGYEMWNSRKPLTRRHIDLVVEEYAKFHATSIAMKQLRPKEFQELIDGFSGDIFSKFFRSYSRVIYFQNIVQEVHDLLKDHLSVDRLKKWLHLKRKVHNIIFDMTPTSDFQVITHGDCWNNNFIYKYEKPENLVTGVAILDWQMSRVSSLITDLSYFLFACSSENDLGSVDDILDNYYKCFSKYLSKMGSPLLAKYSLENFREEWRKFSKFGLIMSTTLIKASFSRNISASKANSETEYKNRVKPIVKYAVEFDII